PRAGRPHAIRGRLPLPLLAGAVRPPLRLLRRPAPRGGNRLALGSPAHPGGPPGGDGLSQLRPVAEEFHRVLPPRRERPPPSAGERTGAAGPGGRRQASREWLVAARAVG